MGRGRRRRSMAAVHPILDAVPTAAHNDMVLGFERRVRNWQLTAWWVLALATLSVAANCAQWFSRKEHYVLIAQGNPGVAQYVHELSAEQAQSLTAKLFVVQDFIHG